jgi:hypothetical protein
MGSPVGELLADLATGLEQAGVEWYVFGAQAAILYGAARLTADVDVTVRLSPATRGATLVGLLATHGFTARFDDAAFIERTRVIPVFHTRSFIPVDVVLAGPGIEDRFFERVRTRDIDGVAVRVASVEDVIVMKILAGRPKDQDDVHAMLAAQGDQLDVRYVRETLAVLEAVLSQSDLLPAFEQALEHIRRQAGPRRDDV